jgi:hypothetical protein
MAEEGAAPAAGDFKFQLTAPVFYNSNPDAATAGGSPTIEGNPDLLLKWQKGFGTGGTQWNLTGSYDAAIDRFGRAMNANGDATTVNTSLQFAGDAYDQNFKPSLGFSETLDFAPTFSRASSSFHDVTLSLDKPFNFNYQRKRFNGIQIADTSAETVWSIDLAGSLARRIGDMSTASRYIIRVSPSLTYNPSIDRPPKMIDGAAAQWSLSLGCTAARLISDELEGVSRRDWYLQPLLTVTFTPPLSWFAGAKKDAQSRSQQAFGMPTATLQIAYTKLSSNVAAAAFQQWQLGPELVLQWKF